MASLDNAGLDALRAFQAALDAGANREVALSVALAKWRAARPSATEWELRGWLVKALAAERRTPGE